MKRAIVLCAIGCGAQATAPAEQPAIVVKMKVTSVTPTPTPTPTPAPAPTRTPTAKAVVRLVQNAVVRATPEANAVLLGVIRKSTRVEVTKTADGWVAIAPRGWVEDNATEPTDEAPTPPAPFTLDDDAPPPRLGVYGFVRGKDVQAYSSRDDAEAGENGHPIVGKMSVRATGSVTVNGRRYWRTSKGELIDASSVVGISPSQFRGVALEADALPPAWVLSHTPIKTHDAAGAVNGELAGRTVVTIQEEDGARVRVGDDAWVAKSQLRIASFTEPPAGVGADEKWFDIDRDQQVLVAYEGTRPVYATLVSTGKLKHETPTLIARIATKHEHTTMANTKGDEAYSVADVPWAMFYDRDYALHTSYWHDGFGSTRSHGCVNLSPRDARALYHWSSPDVPPGWITVYGNAESPGSVVRIRSRRDPEPDYRGYARDLQVDRRVAAQ